MMRIPFTGWLARRRKKDQRVYPAANWNLRVHRDPKHVASEVERLLNKYDRDILTVQEALGYVRALRRNKWIKQHFRVRSGKAFSWRANSAILVRRTVKQSPRTHIRSMGGVRWERGEGRPGTHPARWFVWLGIGARGDRTRLGSWHGAPGPFTRWWPLRRKAKRTELRELTDMLQGWNHEDRRWAIPGDFNNGRKDPEIQEFLEDTGSVATGHGIDWVAHRGVKIQHFKELGKDEFSHGSDHNPNIFDMVVP